MMHKNTDAIGNTICMLNKAQKIGFLKKDAYSQKKINGILRIIAMHKHWRRGLK
jgi:hypothetical protein